MNHEYQIFFCFPYIGQGTADKRNSTLSNQTWHRLSLMGNHWGNLLSRRRKSGSKLRISGKYIICLDFFPPSNQFSIAELNKIIRSVSQYQLVTKNVYIAFVCPAKRSSHGTLVNWLPLRMDMTKTVCSAKAGHKNQIKCFPIMLYRPYLEGNQCLQRVCVDWRG